MKKTFILFQMLFVMAAFCSCQHKETDDKAVINEVCDDICGAYILESVYSVDGAAMDLDGDGESRQELIHEFSKLPSAVPALTYIVRIERVQEYNLKKYFRMEIPVQYLDYDASSKKYSFANEDGHGGTANFSLYYYILPSGELCYGSYTGQSGQFASDLPVESGKTGVDVADARFYDYVRFGNDELSFIVNAWYYDFASGKYAEFPVSYTYRKVS